MSGIPMIAPDRKLWILPVFLYFPIKPFTVSTPASCALKPYPQSADTRDSESHRSIRRLRRILGKSGLGEWPGRWAEGPMGRVGGAYLWICPFLCRYSRPSSTSLRIVAMAASSKTPLLCSPLATMCLIMSRTEPKDRRQNLPSTFDSFTIIWSHFETKPR